MFNYLSVPDVGRVKMSWVFVDCKSIHSTAHDVTNSTKRMDTDTGDKSFNDLQTTPVAVTTTSVIALPTTYKKKYCRGINS